MVDHCVSSLFANFGMSRGKLKYDSFRTFDRNNMFQVSVCRSTATLNMLPREDTKSNFWHPRADTIPRFDSLRADEWKNYG